MVLVYAINNERDGVVVLSISPSSTMSWALCPTPFAQQHLKLLGPPNSGRSGSVAEWAPSLKKGDGRLRPIYSSNNASRRRGAPGGMLNRSTPRRLRRSFSQLR